MVGIFLAFAFLGVRLYAINRDNGESYKKQVLSQQRYDSKAIPARRGDILDAKGIKLATSEKVYNVILDTYALNAAAELLAREDGPDAVQETISLLVSSFDLDRTELTGFIQKNPDSRYKILKKQLKFSEIAEFREILEDPTRPEITGVWFEEEFKRFYPNGSLACDLVGFTTGDGIGTYGLEEYYNSTLNGTNGREYGFLNDDSALERSTIPARDGYTLETTIDANIQQIVEKYLKEFNEANKDQYREGNGAENVGCIVMDCNTGGVLAMGSFPDFDLNDPYDLSDYYTEEEIETMKEEDTFYATCNKLWRNFCISDTYEPGSVAKMLTLASGLDTGKIKGNEHYFCGGLLEIGGHKIHCHNTYGDGELTVRQAIAKSCNVALMQMAQAVGKDDFLKYQNEFNLGLKTNIDLVGEPRTDSLVNTKENMGPTELATASFGQGFNVTMIQMAAAYCSLVNGGKYYQPHVVEKVVNSDGVTIKNIEPRVIKQTIAESTSQQMREYGKAVVLEGTGKTARPAGYIIGGKTGTAEMVPRDKRSYVVSFAGFAPADDPQLLVYVVVDRPNARFQDDAKFATRIVRNVLSEVLPYMNIYMTEELTEDERKELEEKQIQILENYAREQQLEEGEASAEEGDASTEEGAAAEEGASSGEAEAAGESASSGGNGTTGEGGSSSEGDELETVFTEELWKTFSTDPETGYLVDPNTGDLIDPETGANMTGYSMMDREMIASPGSSPGGEPPEGDNGGTPGGEPPGGDNGAQTGGQPPGGGNGAAGDTQRQRPRPQ